MRPVEIQKDIFWIGALDFNKREFHGYSLSPRGTTYNAYLIKDRKNVVMDTVDGNCADALLRRLTQILPPERVDYLVINHTEKDHAGALPEVVRCCRPEKIFTTAMGKKFMQAQFDAADWPIEVVKTGDSVHIGSRTIRFIEMRMIHWPDSMASYIPENKLLVSNDAFGQNIASSERFADQLDRASVLDAVKEYYYNIVLPFSPLVLKTLDAIEQMGLEIEMIAPDHGLISRGADAAFMLRTYRALAEQKPRNRAMLLYDTMWRSTEIMARAIASGLEDEDVPYTILDCKIAHHSRIMKELADCWALIVGSPTHNNGVLPGIANALTYMKGLRPLNRIGAAFGSYGWSGEAPKIIHDWLESMHMDMPAQPLKVFFTPGRPELDACHELGLTVARALKAKVAVTGA